MKYEELIPPQNPYGKSIYLKRGMDITVSILALPFLMLVFFITGLFIRRDGGPTFFRQQRIGRNGSLFSCYKLRSMPVDAELQQAKQLQTDPQAAEEWRIYQKFKKDNRITPVGNLIRRTSIDELPQFVNILKGDMSLVGPRPITPDQVDCYGEAIDLYKRAIPGITGPWQVNGRNTLTFEQRVRLEADYVRNWSLWKDIMILLKTLPAMLKKDEAF